MAEFLPKLFYIKKRVKLSNVYFKGFSLFQFHFAKTFHLRQLIFKLPN